jgi:aminoglycoside phosphotransferase family enzyme
VRLNRRLSPDVYLDVVQVVEHDGVYHVGGPGSPVEPAVRMRRMPEEGMLRRLLERGAVNVTLIERLARRLARFHVATATGAGVDEFGTLTTVRMNWDENFRQTQQFPGDILPAERRDRVRSFVDHFLREHAELFAQRVNLARVRDGQGDLHLDSICVEGRRLHLFDCVEFAARFRCADVAAKIALLAMDLDHAGRADLSSVFVNAYVRASGDTDVRRLIGFYSCYRAYVWGKVLGLRIGEPGLTAEQAAKTTAEAQAYFDLAWAYAGGVRQPVLGTGHGTACERQDHPGGGAGGAPGVGPSVLRRGAQAAGRHCPD